jgi:hypothetical protein
VARPNWEYIRVDVLLPEHPKIDQLTRSARWTLLELWCWCGLNRTDGFVRDAKWRQFGTKRERDQLLQIAPGQKHGFAEKVEGGYLMHDYVGPNGHQRSKREIDELSQRRAEAGRKGGRSRGRPQASA